MSVVLDESKILEEVVVKLRNSDIFTITARSVTTQTDTGTYATATGSHTISRSNVKNIRSITVDSIALTYGTDYEVDYDYNSTCVITYVSNKTGDYSIVYDYGTDKIFAGYPRNDISISSFPRIGVEFIDITSDTGGFGNVNQNIYDISITVYALGKDDLRTYIKSIRTAIIAGQNTFYRLKVVKPRLQGPILVGDFDKFKDRIFQKSLDIRSIFNLEVN